jgi:hypothetical protein
VIWAVRIALLPIGAVVLLAYVPGKRVQEIEAAARRAFYANHLDARADRAYRAFHRLLEQSHRLSLEPAERRAQSLQEWDSRVRNAIRVYCPAVRDEMYYTHTRALSPRHPNLPLAEDQIGVAQDALRRLLEDIDQEPERTLQ